MEISQYIKFSDLTTTGEDQIPSAPDIEATNPTRTALNWPSFANDEFSDLVDEEPRLSNEDEDTLLKDTTGSFADWVASFIRRVIQLLENLPEEGPNGSSGGAVEGLQSIPAGSCSVAHRFLQCRWWTLSPALAVKSAFICRSLCLISS